MIKVILSNGERHATDAIFFTEGGLNFKAEGHPETVTVSLDDVELIVSEKGEAQFDESVEDK